MMRFAVAFVACLAMTPSAGAQYAPATPSVVSIWPNGAPGVGNRRSEPEVAKDYWVRNVHNPSLTIFRPERQNGAAVIVIPGGAHKMLVWTTEGVNVAQALNRYGLTAFVLKYRLARDEGSPYKIDDAAADVRRSIRLGARTCADVRRRSAACRHHGFLRGRRARLARRRQSGDAAVRGS